MSGSGVEIEAGPQPFDPPTAAEADDAVATALIDPNIQASLGNRYVTLGVALATEKVPGAPSEGWPRLFDVWFYDYTSDSVVWAVVDPATRQVVRVVPVDFAFHPPLAGAEVERARSLALSVPGVAERFPGELPFTAMLLTGQGTLCPVNRCAIVAFVEEGPVMDHLTLVNLSQDRVDGVFASLAEVYEP